MPNSCVFFTSSGAHVKLRYYSDVIHLFDWKSAIDDNGGVLMRDSVLSARYSSLCNVLRQWIIFSSLLIESTYSMIADTYDCIIVCIIVYI